MFNFASLMTIKGDLDKFRNNHPKINSFIDSVKAKAPCEGQEIAIAIRYPDGSEYKTGIRVTKEDLQLLEKLKDIAGNI